MPFFGPIPGSMWNFRSNNYGSEYRQRNFGVGGVMDQGYSQRRTNDGGLSTYYNQQRNMGGYSDLHGVTTHQTRDGNIYGERTSSSRVRRAYQGGSVGGGTYSEGAFGQGNYNNQPYAFQGDQSYGGQWQDRDSTRRGSLYSGMYGQGRFGQENVGGGYYNEQPFQANLRDRFQQDGYDDATPRQSTYGQTTGGQYGGSTAGGGYGAQDGYGGYSADDGYGQDPYAQQGAYARGRSSYGGGGGGGSRARTASADPFVRDRHSRAQGTHGPYMSGGLGGGYNFPR